MTETNDLTQTCPIETMIEHTAEFHQTELAEPEPSSNVTVSIDSAPDKVAESPTVTQVFAMFEELYGDNRPVVAVPVITPTPEVVCYKDAEIIPAPATLQQAVDEEPTSGEVNIKHKTKNILLGYSRPPKCKHGKSKFSITVGKKTMKFNGNQARSILCFLQSAIK